MRPRSLVASILAVALVTVSSGCAPVETRVVKTIVHTPGIAGHPWIGKPESMVLETWGPNPTRETDGAAGSILAYRGDSRTLSLAPSHASPPTDKNEPWPPSSLEMDGVVANPQLEARFWIDEAGSVYRVWFAPAVVKAGRDVPPTPAGD
jgi:hypothetical protein